MSRSNPISNNPNPATKFFEWRGSEGAVQYYDREAKENIKVPGVFKFLVLDELSTVTGYNKRAKSGVYANEVRDVRTDVLHVKMFNGEEVSSGIWSEIKEKVNFKNGSFATSCYMAFKEDGEMKIGNLKISGCALGPWIDFRRKHQKDINTKAVAMTAGEKDTSGTVEFIPPEFSIIEITPEADEKAKELDRELQAFLTGYLKRGHTAQGTDNLPGEDIPPEHREEPAGTETQEQEPDPDDLNAAIPKDGPKKAEQPATKDYEF